MPEAKRGCHAMLWVEDLWDLIFKLAFLLFWFGQGPTDPMATAMSHDPGGLTETEKGQHNCEDPIPEISKHKPISKNSVAVPLPSGIARQPLLQRTWEN